MDNRKDLNFSFKAREIIVPITAAMLAITVVLLLFYAAIALTYGSAMAAEPEDRHKKAEAFASMADKTERNQVVFFGDSITEMYDLDKFFPGKNYVNRGIGGDMTSDLIARAASSVIALEPSVVVLLVGTNDLHSESVEKTSERYRELIDILADGLPETRLIVESVLPICTLNSPFSRMMIGNRTNEKIAALNAEIVRHVDAIKVARPELDIVYADTYSLLADGLNLNRLYALDGLHINDLGYAALSGCLTPLIN